ncbi:MAG: hypothetical protein PHS41_08360 [Victivallaceae bacterium]|nr:hypothetical protein [Victivallaceae bacterium]
MKKRFWNPASVSSELNLLLQCVSSVYSDRLGPENGEEEMIFPSAPSGVLTVRKRDGKWEIAASTLSAQARGVGCALAGTEVNESTTLEKLGLMVDVSRNKVPTIAYLKNFCLRAALDGYNLVMLYAENLYRIPEEPFFGYMRGAYTLAEIRELDDYAANLGLELTACIQTLGHMEQTLQLSTYGDIQDSWGTMRTDTARTYELIEEMIRFWSGALRSRRLHVGMDEVPDIGLGKSLGVHGYQDGFTLFNKHLQKVNQIAGKYGLNPMIWSDVYFRLSNPNRDYYDVETQVPESVRREIPPNVQLCYWDYYHENVEIYEKLIQKHRQLGFEPVVASGIWTWLRMSYDSDSMRFFAPCIEACRKNAVKELFFTMWGDIGSYYIADSVFAGMELAAGLAYGELANSPIFAPRLKAISGKDYHLYHHAGAALAYREGDLVGRTEFILWDDPLFGGTIAHFRSAAEGFLKRYRDTLAALAEKKELAETKDPALKTIQAIARLAVAKIDCNEALLAAYREKNLAELKRISETEISRIIGLAEQEDQLSREDWLRGAKPFGLEVNQARNHGAIERLRECARRIDDYLNKRIETIDELDEALRVENLPKIPLITFSGSVIR